MATVTELGTRLIDTSGTYPKTVTATPAVGDLIVVVVFASNTSTPTITVTDDNSSGTYFQGPFGWAAATDRVATILVREALIGSASSTVFSVDTSGGSTTGGGLAVFKVTGMSRTGSSAIRQQGEQDSGSAGGTPTVALSVGAALTGNPLIGALCNQSSPAGVTHRSSPAWTEAFDVGWSTPTGGAEVMFINSGETASTITWGGTSASLFSAAVIELDTSSAGTNIDITEGVITLTGQSVTVSTEVSVVSGAVGVAGQAVAIDTGVPVAAGAVSLSGQSVTITVGLEIGITAGAISLSGRTITVADLWAFQSDAFQQDAFQLEVSGADISITAGALSLAGQSITVSIGTTIPVTAGAITLTGQSFPLTKNFAVTPGAITFTGQTVTIGVGTQIPVSAGAISLTGSSVTLDKGFTVVAAQVAYTGQSVGVVQSGAGIGLPVFRAKVVLISVEGSVVRVPATY